MKVVYSNELYHHGVKGMHWGVRKKSYDDGRIGTKTYKTQYGTVKVAPARSRGIAIGRTISASKPMAALTNHGPVTKSLPKATQRRIKAEQEAIRMYDRDKKAARSPEQAAKAARRKKVALAALGVAGAAAAGYGMYKLNEASQNARIRAKAKTKLSDVVKNQSEYMKKTFPATESIRPTTPAKPTSMSQVSALKRKKNTLDSWTVNDKRPHVASRGPSVKNATYGGNINNAKVSREKVKQMEFDAFDKMMRNKNARLHL